MRYVFLFLMWITPAHAEFYNYSQWERLSEAARLAYIAGAIDELTLQCRQERLRCYTTVNALGNPV